MIHTRCSFMSIQKKERKIRRLGNKEKNPKRGRYVQNFCESRVIFNIIQIPRIFTEKVNLLYSQISPLKYLDLIFYDLKKKKIPNFQEKLNELSHDFHSMNSCGAFCVA